MAIPNDDEPEATDGFGSYYVSTDDRVRTLCSKLKDLRNVRVIYLNGCETTYRGGG